MSRSQAGRSNLRLFDKQVADGVPFYGKPHRGSLASQRGALNKSLHTFMKTVGYDLWRRE